MAGSRSLVAAGMISGALAFAGDARAAAELVGAEAATASAAEEGPFRTRSPYLHIAPFGIGSFGDPALFWGLGGGIMVPRGRRALISVGGFGEHVLVLSQPDPVLEERRIQLLRFGPEVRVGGGRRVFGYGLFRLGLELLLWRDLPEAGVMSTLGGGVQGLATKRLLMGAEVGVDVSFFGVNGVVFLPRLRVFTGFKF